MPLRQICEQEGISYLSYIARHSREGLAPRRKRNHPERMVEMEADITSFTDVGPSPKAPAVHIEFGNGLKFDRADMEVDTLIGLLTKIRCALCLG